MEFVEIPIHQEADIIVARQQAKDMAQRIGFNEVERCCVATSISELATNVYPGHKMVWGILKCFDRFTRW